MGHLYHGYVSHNQRVNKHPVGYGTMGDIQPPSPVHYRWPGLIQIEPFSMLNWAPNFEVPRSLKNKFEWSKNPSYPIPMPFHNAIPQCHSTLCISCDILVNLYHHPITSKAPPQVDASSWRSGNGGGPKPPWKNPAGRRWINFRYPDGTFLMGKSMGKPWENHGKKVIYMENHPFLWVNPLFQWQISIANY